MIYTGGQGMWELESYEKADGNCPLNDFLVDPKKKNDLPFIEKAFERLEKYGNQLGYPHTSPLGDDLFELRGSTKRGIFRFPFFFDKGKIIIITHGFQRKQQKTPRSEINLARKYMNDYFLRKDKRI
jgi:phage-related protein